jgi:hypothetical protein
MSNADLISRLEALTGPSREVDADISLVVHPWLKDCPRDDREDSPGWMTKDGRTYAARYTESTDAAIAAVPEGLRWELWGGLKGKLFRGEVWPLSHNASVLIGHSDANPGIALMIAICKYLRARETEGK